MRRAFSLLEVLLALAILVALLSTLGQFTWTVGTAQQRLNSRAARQAGVDAVIDRLASSLDSAAVTVRGNAGFRGDETSVQTSVAEDRPGGSMSKALAAMRPVGVVFNEEERAVRLDGGTSIPLGDLRFRYFDGTAWLDAFDSSEAGALPRAVLVEAWIEPVATDPSDANHPPDRRCLLSPSGVWMAEE